MNLKEELKALVGTKLNGVAFNIDLVASCCLACPSCAVGSIGGRKGKPMDVYLFKKILDKAQSECKIRKIQLYIYTDPMLHPYLHLIVEECTKRGIKTMISTMLQTLKADMWKVIEARPTEFRISFPGWNKMNYYQNPARPEVFDRNFEKAMKLPRYKETKWNLVYHLYNDNKDEIPRAQKLAHDNGLHLVILPAIFMPLEKTVEKRYSEEDKLLISHLLETPEQAMSRMTYDKDWCNLWKQVSLDSKGDVYLCQLIYEDRFKLGVNYLDAPLKEIRRMVKGHPFCNECMECGAHQYQNCYSEMTEYDDPVAHANKKRHFKGYKV